MKNTRPNLEPIDRANSRIPRKRQSQVFWVNTQTEFSKSGLSVQGFCDFKKLSPSNFYAWRKRLQSAGNNKPLASTTFIPLEVMGNEQLVESSEEQAKTLEEYASPAIEEEGCDSGLSLHLKWNLKISIDNGFHKPTFMRLMSLFSSKEIEPC